MIEEQPLTYISLSPSDSLADFVSIKRTRTITYSTPNAARNTLNSLRDKYPFTYKNNVNTNGRISINIISLSRSISIEQTSDEPIFSLLPYEYLHLRLQQMA